jgi:hypothetical protein
VTTAIKRKHIVRVPTTRAEMEELHVAAFKAGMSVAKFTRISALEVARNNPNAETIAAMAEPPESIALPDPPEYVSWENMVERCTNRRRGPRIRDQLEDFATFLYHMGVQPPGTTLDRWPDPNGDYAVGNLRWATPAQKRANQRKRTPTPKK